MEQQREACQLVFAGPGDLVVLRNADESHLSYWSRISDGINVLNYNVSDDQLGKYLTSYILKNPSIIRDIKQQMWPSSVLKVFSPTDAEKLLFEKLEIPLYGNPYITSTYGTKSGIRSLVAESNFVMAPGFVCDSLKEIDDAIFSLRKLYLLQL